MKTSHSGIWFFGIVTPSLRRDLRGLPSSAALFGISKRCLAHPGAFVPRFLPSGEAFPVHRATALHDAPEFVPVDRPEIMALLFLVPPEIGVGNLQPDKLRLGNRRVDKFLAQLVVGEP